MEKLNSYWLLKQNDCDILCKIQKSIINGNRCILNVISDTPQDCKQPFNNPNPDICTDCIRNWMSRERK